MSYSSEKDPLPRATARRESPAVKGRMLVAGDLSDSADLAVYAKSARVYNKTSSAIAIVVTPMKNADADTMIFTIPAGERETIPLMFRRVWVTGSTGLQTGLTASTVEVQLYLE